MADNFKVLGQSAPAINTDTALYTVPTARSAVLKLVICNESSGSVKVRARIGVGGASAADGQYLYYDFQVPANSTLEMRGITMAAGDVLAVQSDTNPVSFSALGDEVS